MISVAVCSDRFLPSLSLYNILVQSDATEMSGDRPAVKAKPRMERNRVLVTGGAGFVGSHLCDYLVTRGDHVSFWNTTVHCWLFKVGSMLKVGRIICFMFPQYQRRIHYLTTLILFFLSVCRLFA